jgi:Adenylate and Guanylate cyclase catalytic domain
VPRVVIVPPAGTVEFLNSDRLLHNLHSVSRENPSFNRTQPKGRTIPVTFAKPEIVRIDCDLLGYELALGVGIAQGYATIGAIGFESRIDYAAIGTVTNLASRLCDEAAPWQILVSPRVTAEVGHLVELEDVGELTLKGLRRPVPARNVLRTRPSAHAA